MLQPAPMKAVAQVAASPAALVAVPRVAEVDMMAVKKPLKKKVVKKVVKKVCHCRLVKRQHVTMPVWCSVACRLRTC